MFTTKIWKPYNHRLTVQISSNLQWYFLPFPTSFQSEYHLLTFKKTKFKKNLWWPLRIKANSIYNQYTCLEKDYLPHRGFVNSHTKTYSSHNNWNFSIHPLLLDLISFSWFQTCIKHLHYNLYQCQRSCFIETYSGNFRNKKESELKWKMGKQTHAMLHWLHPSRALLIKGWRMTLSNR